MHQFKKRKISLSINSNWQEKVNQFASCKKESKTNVGALSPKPPPQPAFIMHCPVTYLSDMRQDASASTLQKDVVKCTTDQIRLNAYV